MLIVILTAPLNKYFTPRARLFELNIICGKLKNKIIIKKKIQLYDEYILPSSVLKKLERIVEKVS